MDIVSLDMVKCVDCKYVLVLFVLDVEVENIKRPTILEDSFSNWYNFYSNTYNWEKIQMNYINIKERKTANHCVIRVDAKANSPAVWFLYTSLKKYAKSCNQIIFTINYTINIKLKNKTHNIDGLMEISFE